MPRKTDSQSSNRPVTMPVTTRRSRPVFQNPRTFSPSTLPTFFDVSLTEQATYTYSAATYDTQCVRLNSLYDPDYSFGGGQPTYFDQLKALYSSYTVVAAEYKLSFITTMSTVPLMVAVAPSIDAWSGPPSSYNLAESKFARYKVLVAKCPFPAEFTGSVDVGFMHGVSASILGMPNFQASTGANPANPVYLSFQVSSMDGATNVSYYLSWSITYHARFHDIVEAPES